MATNLSSSFNPWSADGSVAGMQLGDPESGLVIARRHGLVSNNVSFSIEYRLHYPNRTYGRTTVSCTFSRLMSKRYDLVSM